MRLKLLAAFAPLSLAACVTPPGDVEVTRFVAADTGSRLGTGTIFVETAAGTDGQALELAPYKAAVARELAALGYREAARNQANQIAQVSIDRGVLDAGDRRGPVSVGVGGSTGSYGSGVGLGVGVNLGGGRKEEIATRLEVRIRDKANEAVLWEGRALFDVATSSILADSAQNASVMAEALFRSFPGNSGETVLVPVQRSNPDE
ncbi:DUF4136 domain-containing protein [Erythrobacter litoralis]|uniref:DUF4136 domain-containing protein n=1 Tax=Erythrobacter litoralis (strain HTCC2594) TaxID=314225 RepID=Q2N7R2_ERYLH|nr:DUF4136 domain-containing protein [Erythrobacter litoralis]ABC64279.1 hypothetical protein ELI_10935 [Erythrobacter litoralis HTCC2594]